MKKERFAITGMTCSACSARVEKAVTALAGTEKVSVNLLTNSMQLFYDEGQVSPVQIIEAVEKAGYGASLKGEKAEQRAKGKDDPLAGEAAGMKQRLWLSVVFLCLCSKSVPTLKDTFAAPVSSVRPASTISISLLF